MMASWRKYDITRWPYVFQLPLIVTTISAPCQGCSALGAFSSATMIGELRLMSMSSV